MCCYHEDDVILLLKFDNAAKAKQRDCENEKSECCFVLSQHAVRRAGTYLKGETWNKRKPISIRQSSGFLSCSAFGSLAKFIFSAFEFKSNVFGSRRERGFYFKSPRTIRWKRDYLGSLKAFDTIGKKESKPILSWSSQKRAKPCRKKRKLELNIEIILCLVAVWVVCVLVFFFFSEFKEIRSIFFHSFNV